MSQNHDPKVVKSNKGVLAAIAAEYSGLGSQDRPLVFFNEETDLRSEFRDHMFEAIIHAAAAENGEVFFCYEGQRKFRVYKLALTTVPDLTEGRVIILAREIADKEKHPSFHLSNMFQIGSEFYVFELTSIESINVVS